MPKRTTFFNFIGVGEEQWFFDYDIINWKTWENALSHIFELVGSGIINGWDVTDLSLLQDEVDALPSSITDTLEHTESCMMVRVDKGDGIIVPYAAYTPEPMYLAFPIEAESKIYYVYAVPTDCLASEQRATIAYNEDPDYASTHAAAFLAKVTTYYDPVYNETYIYRVEYGNDRRYLKNLRSAAMDAIEDAFRRHRHTGGPNAPSQINLSTMDVEMLSVQPSSTIFQLTPFVIVGQDVTETSRNLPSYIAAKIYLNGRLLSSSEYDLDNQNGKLYFMNSVAVTDSVQVVKYLEPSDTEIARGPQDDPVSPLSGSFTGTYDDTTVDPDYRLPGSRIASVPAEKVTGTLDKRKIRPIDHWGLNRIRENLSLNPRVETRTSDGYKYWLVPPDTEMSFDTRVVTIQRSRVIDGTVVSIPKGLYLVNGEDVHDLTRLGHSEDDGRVLELYDNLVEGEHGGEDKFHEVYLLTDHGKVFISYDEGVAWTPLQIPVLDGIFVQSFTVSTDKVEREVNNTKTYDYYKVYNLGTNLGLFTARVLGAKGNAAGGSDLQFIESIAWARDEFFGVTPIVALQEIITEHVVSGDGNTSRGYDRTLYVSTADGVYCGHRLVAGSSTMDCVDMLWSTNNCLLALSQDKIYVSHTAKYVVEETAETTTTYWKHPLTQVDETLHVTKDFSADGRVASRISQEWGRARYIVGLADGVAVSSIDGTMTAISQTNPLLPISLGVEGATRGVLGLGIGLSVSSDHGAIGLPLTLSVKSLANVADDEAMTDAQKEQADGWKILDWSYSITDLYGARTVVADEGDQAVYEPEFGQEQTVTYRAATDAGVWYSKDAGSSWKRPMEIWTSGDPLVSKDGVVVPSTEYEKLQSEQAIRFLLPQTLDAIIRIEKDFKEYFAANGPWEQNDADLVVYLNDKETDFQYSMDNVAGKITFQDPLDKNVAVKMSLMKEGAFLSHVGTIPHGEILTALVTNADTATKLSTAVVADERIIKVESTGAFPRTGTFYIQIDSERVKVKRRDTFSFYSVRSRPSLPHDVDSDVYLVEVKDVYGIEDEISLITSDLPYHMHGVVGSNLQRLQMELSRVWPDMLENPPSAYPRAGTQKQGVVNELIFTSGSDSFDPNGAIASLIGGFYVPVTSIPGAPRIISAMKKPVQANNFIVGSDKGVWLYDGSTWKQLSGLDGAAIIYYIEEASNGNLLAGADNGLWISSDDGVTWVQSSTFDQQQLCHLSGQLSWISNSQKPFDAYGKSDGLAMTISNWDGVHASSFRSDHYDDVDGYRVYGLFKGSFFRVNKETGQKTTYESIWICSENGLYVTYSGTRLRKDGSPNPYSALLKGREAVDPGYRTETTTDAEGNSNTTTVTGDQTDLSKHQGYLFDGYDAEGNPIYRRIKFFGMFQDTRPKSVPIIMLTSDGIRVSRNWRWIDPVPSDEDPVLFLAWEAAPLSTQDPTQRVVCNCYATGSDSTIVDGSANDWRKYKVFVGTNRGLYRSYDGCHTMERCQNIPGATSIYSLDYTSDNRLHAGTSSGYWYSDNDGDDWTQPIQDVGNAIYPDGKDLAQTFLAEQPSLTKVSLYLHPKPLSSNGVGSQPVRPVYSLVAEIRTTDGSGTPTSTVLATSESVSASTVTRDAYYDFIFETSPTLSTTAYAIVLREVGLSGDAYVGWVASPLENPYAEGSGFEYDGSWTKFADRDHYFKVHYVAPSEVTVVEHAISFAEENARRLYVDVDNNMQLDMRFLMSFCLDGSGSMVDADPLDLRTSEPILFFREVLRRAPQSLCDVWAFGETIVEQTFNGPTSVRKEYMAAFGSVPSTGELSRFWSAADTAVGNLDPSGLADYLAMGGKADDAVELMRQMNRIDYDEVAVADPTYDPASGFDGLATHGVAVDYILGLYADSVSPMAFVISDGYDNVNDFDAAEVVETADGILGDGLTPVYFFPMGDNFDSSNMLLVAESTNGELFQTAGDATKLRTAFNLLLNDRQRTIFQGSYEQEVMFEEKTYLQSVELGAEIPLTSDLTFEFQVTYDGYDWGPWRTVPANNRFDVLEFVMGLRFRVKAWLGNQLGGNYYDIYGDEAISDEANSSYGCRYARYYGYQNYSYDDEAEAYYTYRSSTYPSPVIHSLKYWTVTPSVTHLFTPEISGSGIHEYLLSPWSDAPEGVVLNYAIVRGSDPDMNEAERVRANRKGVLPDRRRSIYFTPAVEQIGLETENMDPNTRLIFQVEDADANVVVWDDKLTTAIVYLAGTELDPAVTPFSLIADRGLVWFETAVPTGSEVTVDLMTPGIVASRLGELAVGTNRRTYYPTGGPWAVDSTVTVRVNQTIRSGGYVLDPLEGSVFFFDELLPDDEVTLEIASSGKNRAGVEILNYNDGDYDPPDFALMFSEVPSTETELIASRTVPPVVTEVKLVPEEPSMNSRLEVSYIYSQVDGNAEQGTTIQWFRKKIDEVVFTQYSAYANRNVIRMSDVPSTNPTGPFQAHDQWYVVVTPADANSTGVPVMSNVIAISGHVPPYITTATIIGVDFAVNSADPDNPVTTAQDLEASYTYLDPNAVGDQTATDHSLVRWFKNGSSTVLHEGKTLPKEHLDAGDVIFYLVTPYNNEMEGTDVSSTEIVITGETTAE